MPDKTADRVPTTRVAVALALLVVCILLALPATGSSMQYHVGELLRYTNDYFFFLFPVLLIGFGVQLWLNRPKKYRWPAWILLCFAAAGLLLAEVIWLGGGWNRLLTSFIWVVCFPLLLGSILAILFDFVRLQNRTVQIAATGLLAVVLIASTTFWPRPLSEKIDLMLDSRLLYFEPEGERDWMQAREEEELMRLVQWAKVTPCFSHPDWDAERGILLRLNAEYILLAPHNETPTIYEYAGELDRFAGGTPRWNVYGYPALYGELRTAANRIENETVEEAPL